MTSMSDYLREKKLLSPVTSVPSGYDFQNQVVQFDDDPNNVASGEASILFSCPPVLSAILANKSLSLTKLMVPIGAVTGMQDNETPAMQPFPEVGSRLKRVAFSMASYQVSLGKVTTLHSNLRHALYAWLAKEGAKVSMLVHPSEETSAPGGSHFVTSESELQRIPFGLILFTMTAGGKMVSREFYEKCYVANIGKAVQAGQAIIQENASIYVTRKLPLNGIELANPNGALTEYAFRLGNGDLTTAGATGANATGGT